MLYFCTLSVKGSQIFAGLKMKWLCKSCCLSVLEAVNWEGDGDLRESILGLSLVLGHFSSGAPSHSATFLHSGVVFWEFQEAPGACVQSTSPCTWTTRVQYPVPWRQRGLASRALYQEDCNPTPESHESTPSMQLSAVGCVCEDTSGSESLLLTLSCRHDPKWDEGARHRGKVKQWSVKQDQIKDEKVQRGAAAKPEQSV